MTTLETLFSPMQKEKLRQAALVRTSCRSFAGAPDTAAFAALSYVVGRCALPGARLVLNRCLPARFWAWGASQAAKWRRWSSPAGRKRSAA